MKSRNNQGKDEKDLNGKNNGQPVNDVETQVNPDPESTTGDETPAKDNPDDKGSDGEDAPKAVKEYKKESVVDRMLALYPQYKRAYVSKKGFVFPENTPEWQRGDAILYENKYFTK